MHALQNAAQCERAYVKPLIACDASRHISIVVRTRASDLDYLKHVQIITNNTNRVILSPLNMQFRQSKY